MDSYENLNKQIAYLKEIEGYQSIRLENLEKITSLQNETLALLNKMYKELADKCTLMRDKTTTLFDVYNCRIDLINSVNSIIIASMSKVLNEEESKKLVSDMKQKYNEALQTLLSDKSISEEAKSELKKVSQGGFPIHIVR